MTASPPFAQPKVANDNLEGPSPAPVEIVHILTGDVARMLGARMARAQFAAITAANDNGSDILPTNGEENCP